MGVALRRGADPESGGTGSAQPTPCGCAAACVHGVGCAEPVPPTAVLRRPDSVTAPSDRVRQLFLVRPGGPGGLGGGKPQAGLGYGGSAAWTVYDARRQAAA